MTNPDTYRGWNVNYDHPPIPLRSMDWSATSPDYDVDCDDDGFHVCAGQQVHAATYRAGHGFRRSSLPISPMPQ